MHEICKLNSYVSGESCTFARFTSETIKLFSIKFGIEGGYAETRSVDLVSVCTGTG